MEDELYHHGRLHQKWGVKNGPPYPLSSEKTKGYARKQKRKHPTSLQTMSTEELQRKVDRLDTETKFKKKYAARYVKPSKGLKTIEKTASKAQVALKTIYGDKHEATKIAGSVATASKAAGQIKNNMGMKRVREMDLSKYDDDFLNRMSNRLDLEKKFIELKSEEVNSGKYAVDNMLQGAILVKSIGTVAKTISDNQNKKKSK